MEYEYHVLFTGMRLMTNQQSSWFGVFASVAYTSWWCKCIPTCPLLINGDSCVCHWTREPPILHTLCVHACLHAQGWWQELTLTELSTRNVLLFGILHLCCLVIVGLVSHGLWWHTLFGSCDCMVLLVGVCQRGGFVGWSRGQVGKGEILVSLLFHWTCEVSLWKNKRRSSLNKSTIIPWCFSSEHATQSCCHSVMYCNGQL